MNFCPSGIPSGIECFEFWVIFFGDVCYRRQAPKRQLSKLKPLGLQVGLIFALPETNSSPLKIGYPKRKVVFQLSIFRGYVSFREGNIYTWGVDCFSVASVGSLNNPSSQVVQTYHGQAHNTRDFVALCTLEKWHCITWII